MAEGSGKANRVSKVMPNQKTETFDSMFLPVCECEASVALTHKLSTE